MLNIRFNRTDKTVIDVDTYFNWNYEEIWLDDPMVRKMIEDVDKSIVISSKCIESDALGQITPLLLSGGVKALILLLKEPKLEIWATACGDNCAKWILKIAEMQDIRIVLEHVMHFESDFEAICVNDGKKISYLNDYRDCIFKYL